ncbi:MAG: N-acetyltransferase family protein [Halobacteriaceae archaeon]
MTTIRAYDPDIDRGDLWALKTAFETELGEEGDTETAAAYTGKLTDAYRSEYLSWVARCRAENPACLQVAATDDGLGGYVFVLPESLAYIWDGAVLNEIYVSPDHRGTGVADDLLEAALGVVAEQSLPMDRIVLDVAPENERARRFYRRHGFTELGDLVVREL